MHCSQGGPLLYGCKWTYNCNFPCTWNYKLAAGVTTCITRLIGVIAPLINLITGDRAHLVDVFLKICSYLVGAQPSPYLAGVLFESFQLSKVHFSFDQEIPSKPDLHSASLALLITLPGQRAGCGKFLYTKQWSCFRYPTVTLPKSNMTFWNKNQPFGCFQK